MHADTVAVTTGLAFSASVHDVANYQEPWAQSLVAVRGFRMCAVLRRRLSPIRVRVVPVFSREWQNLMSQSGWYHDKAAQCDRMARASTDTVTRDYYIQDRNNWREIAARIDAAEEAVKQKKKKR